MGNYISCTLSTAIGNHSKAAKVILPDGSIRMLDRYANAAELMLDVPGNFLVNSRSMNVGQRFSPLCADEDLERGNVYAMFPMSRLHSMVAVTDVGRLLMAADSAARRASGERVRILPHTPPSNEVFNASSAHKLQLNEVGDEFVGYRLSMCRSRRPTLEAIAEETVRSI